MGTSAYVRRLESVCAGVFLDRRPGAVDFSGVPAQRCEHGGCGVGRYGDFIRIEIKTSDLLWGESRHQVQCAVQSIDPFSLEVPDVQWFAQIQMINLSLGVGGVAC